MFDGTQKYYNREMVSFHSLFSIDIIGLPYCFLDIFTQFNLILFQKMGILNKYLLWVLDLICNLFSFYRNNLYLIRTSFILI